MPFQEACVHIAIFPVQTGEYGEQAVPTVSFVVFLGYLAPRLRVSVSNVSAV